MLLRDIPARRSFRSPLVNGGGPGRFGFGGLKRYQLAANLPDFLQVRRRRSHLRKFELGPKIFAPLCPVP